MERGRIRIHIEGSLCILLALMLLLLPLKWVVAMIVAIAIHELSHAIAIMFFGGHIYAIYFGGHGIRMETEPLLPGQELIAALAGPVGSASLILLSRYFPRLAVCGAVHCIYNLLPLFPLDGGRVLKNLLDICGPNGQYHRIFRFSQQILRGILMAFGVLASIRFSPFAAVVTMVVLLRYRKVKNLV